MVKGWFLRELPTEKFYTCHVKSKAVFEPIGPGDRKPTPQELADAHSSGTDIYIMDGCVKETIIRNETDEPGIELPNGFYSYAVAAGGQIPERLIPIELREDSMAPMRVYDKICEDIDSFLSNQEVYRNIGTLYRRGLLLYGPPGQGKTTILRKLMTDKFSDAIVVFCRDLPSSTMLRKFQNEESNRLKVFVFEEMAAIVNDNDIDRVLDFLDGELSLDTCFVIGTTNYPERLPKNIVDRPSRFDRLIKIGDPDADTRKHLLELYLKREPSQQEIESTDGLSAAALKEVCLLHHLRKFEIQQAVEYMAQARKLADDEFADNEEVGFNSKPKAYELDDDGLW